jgi:tetratricopeptide (TPR) repeat protein
MNADHSIRTFVRNAWVLLGFQLLAAAAALAVTIWATLQVRPLLAEREQLAREIASGREQLEALKAEEERARTEIAELQTQAATVRAELKGARDATPVLTAAIDSFHRKDYSTAVAKYDQALALNPGDAYVYNLKSYSQYKAGDLDSAIDTLSRSLEMNPAFDWGYFDLARYQCAAGAYDDALDTIARALALRGDPIRRGAAFFLAKDGEFVRVCRPIVADLRVLAGS